MLARVVFSKTLIRSSTSPLASETMPCTLVDTILGQFQFPSILDDSAIRAPGQLFQISVNPADFRNCLIESYRLISVVIKFRSLARETDKLEICVSVTLQPVPVSLNGGRIPADNELKVHAVR